MAKGKRGILVYADWIETFRELSDDEAGRLIKHFFAYVNDEDPEPPDRITALLFTQIQATLKRDLKKWEKRAEASRINGSMGGRPKTKQVIKKPKKTQQVISEPKKPDSVNVSVSVSDSVNVNGITDANASVYRRIRAGFSLSREKFNELVDAGYTPDEIDDILDQIQNYKGNNKYRDLFFTAKNWLKREKERKSSAKKKETTGQWHNVHAQRAWEEAKRKNDNTEDIGYGLCEVDKLD